MMMPPPPPPVDTLRGRSRTRNGATVVAAGGMLSKRSQIPQRSMSRSTSRTRPHTSIGSYGKNNAGIAGFQVPPEKLFKQQRTRGMSISNGGIQQTAEEREKSAAHILSKTTDEQFATVMSQWRESLTKIEKLELDKQKLEDQVRDFQEKQLSGVSQMQNREIELREEHRKRVNELETQILRLKEEHVMTTGDLRSQLVEKEKEMFMKMSTQFEEERQKLHESFTEQFNCAISERSEDIRRHYDALIEQMRSQVNENESRLTKQAQQHEMMLEQASSRHRSQLESAQREIKSLQQQVAAANDKYEAEHHEAEALRRTLKEMSASSVTFETLNKGQEAQIEELRYQVELAKSKNNEMRAVMEAAIDEKDRAREKLLKEETLRRKLHNQVQELKGNIRVFCRVRPTVPGHDDNSQGSAAFEYPDRDLEGQQIIVGDGSKMLPFGFDKVFYPESTNIEVFEEISQLVQSALDGYNVCIFAYGQTGSGKTYTMSHGRDGMIPRAIEQIFETATLMQDRGWSYECQGQFVEIYNENLNDLLASNDSFEKAKLEIRHDTNLRRTTVTDLTSVQLRSAEQVAAVLKRAANNRSVAATKANERSSRSHSVFILRISGANQITGETREGTLNLIDLAGSERLAHSQASGDRLKETQAINKSLSALGDVIHAMAKPGSHVPFRNSKLTYLLQYSLTGNSKTLMFVNISPVQSHLSETISSLRFATKVNNTQLKRK
ncbi:kinesin-like protein Kar3p [Trichomonascus vanleenenianus]|uniref:Kar3p n=1 Tax=Trichomonascus vanleenenianus TaxID=2268995 RepID=UPI003ECB4D4D